MNKSLVLFAAPAAALALLAAACGGADAPSARASSNAAAAAAAQLPPGLFADAIDGVPMTVVDAKANAAEGDEITIIGLVGGRANPFVAGRAMAQIVDLGLPPCGMASATPWDYCSVPAEEVARHSLTIQVAGPDGRPLAAELNGPGGLRPGQEVIVHGVVSQKAEGVLVVDARRIAGQ